MATTASVIESGDQNLDALLSGIRWGTLSLTFSFPESSSHYGSSYVGGEPKNGFLPLNEAQSTAARNIFAMIASFTNLDLTEIQEDENNHADVRLASANISASAWAYYPAEAEYGGDAWFRASSSSFADVRAGSYGFYVFMHEIGHALGMKHGHEPYGFGALAPEQDSMEYSVMTYRSYVGAAGTIMENETWGYAQSLMMYDIAAVQHMYGADFTTNSSNTVYRWNPLTGQQFINGAGQAAPGGNRIFTTIWDGGGIDTYDFSNYTTGLEVDLRPGEWSSLTLAQTAQLGFLRFARGNIANSLLYQGDLRSLIENAIGGSGSDIIIGNMIANVLKGRGGPDRLSGLEGNDTLVGGAGMDTLLGGTGRDVFLFNTRPSRTTNLERLGDFSAVDDTIFLENAVFTKLGMPGRLPTSAFWAGPKAHDLSDRIIYNKVSGTLYYDADGTGQAPQVLIGWLPKGLKITAGDFWIT
ncbi:matrixin [Microvirga sp. KLBC 81]|uniref:M10 family metallopeptidase n=1 Tax=Microvirga sp. KLBC 81 TaxID=1862707 RepID=UPI000D511EF9|nr:M10 family metallopeptidase [Microvirga sp. KLBC 81]PVE23720.1 matrixin [Microvirga sp. KLBC 81]